MHDELINIRVENFRLYREDCCWKGVIVCVMAQSRRLWRGGVCTQRITESDWVTNLLILQLKSTWKYVPEKTLATQHQDIDSLLISTA